MKYNFFIETNYGYGSHPKLWTYLNSTETYIIGIESGGNARAFLLSNVKFLRDDEVVARKLLDGFQK
jgi:hypothetical protein